MEKENIPLKRYGNTRSLFQVPCSIELKLVQLPRFASGDFAEELCLKLVELCTHHCLVKDEKGTRGKFNKFKQQPRGARERIYFRDFHRKQLASLGIGLRKQSSNDYKSC